MQSEPHSFILSLKNQQISFWKEMDWGLGRGLGKYGQMEVDIQRAELTASVFPTILSASTICKTSISSFFCQLEQF